jgi:hypothetical protein
MTTPLTGFHDRSIPTLVGIITSSTTPLVGFVPSVWNYGSVIDSTATHLSQF